MVLQFCVPPFRLGVCAEPRMSANRCIDRAWASEVARESDLHILRVDTIQFKLSQHIIVGQERVYDELKLPDDAADSGAYHHNQFVLVKVEARFPANGRLIAKQDNDAGC